MATSAGGAGISVNAETASGYFIKYITKSTTKYPKRAYLKVWWESKPIGNNKSEVHAWAKLYRPYTISNTASRDVAISIAGNVKNGTRTGGWGGKGWTDTLIEHTVNCTHDSSGKKKIYIWAEAEFDCKIYGQTISGHIQTTKTLCQLGNLLLKDDITMPGVDLTQTPTFYIGDTINLQLERKMTSLTHNITLEMNDYNHTVLIKANDDGVTTDYNVTLEPSVFIPPMAGNVERCKITCKTYNGSKLLGTVTIPIIISLRESDRPKLTDDMLKLTVVPISPNNYTDRYIQRKSQCRFILTIPNSALTAGVYSKNDAIKNLYITHYTDANNSKKSIVNVKERYISNDSTNTIITGNIEADLKGNNIISLYVVDKRHLQSNIISTTFYVHPYTSPLINNFTITRCLEDGTPDDSGTYMNFVALFKVAHCGDDADRNKLEIVIQQKEDTASSYTVALNETDYDSDELNIILPSYSADKRYNFILTITDKFGASDNAAADISTEKILIDMYKDGVCIGGIANRSDAFEVVTDAYFEGDIFSNITASTSDARLKQDISYNLGKLLPIWSEMQTVLFRYKNKPDKIQAGFIAQDIIKLFDKYELDWKEYGVVYQDDITGYYSLNYEFINRITMLIVQMLVKEVAELKKK